MATTPYAYSGNEKISNAHIAPSNEDINNLHDFIDGEQPPDTPTVNLDGNTYLTREILYDFQSAAFSEELWANSIEKSSSIDNLIYLLPKNDSERKHSINFFTDSPLSVYALRPNGLPKIGVINKWTSPIRVGFQLPSGSNSPVLQESSTQINIIEEAARSAAETLSRALGIEIEVIPADTSNLPPGKEPNLFILTFNADDPKRTIKRRAIDVDSGYKPSQFNFERVLIGAIAFTPTIETQVDGYLIPNERNEVEKAVCKIPNNINVHFYRPLVEECLIRSLGLPSAKSASTDGLLGTWNIGPESHKQSISQYDLALASLLYCESVRPGMDKLEALQAILLDLNCMDKL